MAKLSIYHFSPLRAGTPVEPLIVEIAEPIPELKSSSEGFLDEYRITFRDQGRKLAKALIDHLPGGTVDQLLVALLDHKANLFRVGYEK